MSRNNTIKALECCSHKPRPDCVNCPMGEKRGCAVELYTKSLELVKELKADTVKKTIDAVKSKGVRNAYSCMISGEMHENYTISGKALDEIEKEMLEEKNDEQR